MPEIRDDLEAIRLSLRPRPTQASGRNFVGKVVDRGAYPSSNGRVLIVNPVEVAGDEVEGGAATITVHEDSDVPVVFVGRYGPDIDTDTPPIGSLLIVERVSGRWVNQAMRTTSYWTDQGNIPRRDLSVDWFMVIDGFEVYAGTFTLAWDGFTTWVGDDGHAGFRISVDIASRHATIQPTYDGADVGGLEILADSVAPWSKTYLATEPPLTTNHYDILKIY